MSSPPASQGSKIHSIDCKRRVAEESVTFDGWKITSVKAPILPSNCYCDKLCSDNTKGMVLERKLSGNDEEPLKCQVCRYAAELQLKHYPEMVFPDNILHLEHEKSGLILQFNCLDAMKLMSVDSEAIQVASSEVWKKSRAAMGLPLPKDASHDFNWTFTSDYKGSVKLAELGMEIETNPSETIDFEKLKRKEQLLFFTTLTLYEDELHDNGVSTLSAKIRVMPSGFFILLRFFLRVDKVLVKMYDTRIYYEKGNPYLLRQFQIRGQSYENLKHLDPSSFADPNHIYPYLPISEESTDKIIFDTNKLN